MLGQRHAGGRSLCIVDEHLNAAEGIDSLLDHICHSGLVVAARADIGLHGQHLDAVEAFQLLPGCFQLLDIAACDDEVRALLGVCGGDAVADGAAAPILQDSAPCAGNDGGFTS